MEEDLKILECENVGDLASIELIDLLNEENGYDLNRLKQQALENLIKGYRSEKEQNIASRKVIVEQCDYIQNKSIPKSKVKEKIEFYEKNFNMVGASSKVSVLKELLMEDK